MSSQSTGLNASNALIVNRDTSKIFLRNTRSQTGNNVNNASYDDQTILAGTVMGRVALTGNLVPWFSAATDGSQFPVGILMQDMTIESGDSDTVTICDGGDVAEDKVLFFYNGDSLDSVVSSRQLRDHLQAQGIKLVSATEMTAYDNQ